MRRILIALCAVTMLSGCGGGVDASLLATAARNTEAAGGAELALRMTMTAQGEEIVMTGTGVEDARGRRGHFDLTAPEIGEMEMVADGFTLYMRMDALEAALGSEWIKLDLTRIGDELGIDMEGVGQIGQGAAEQLGWLKAASDGVSEHGTDTVVGVEATHYSATVDLRRYPDLAPEGRRETIRQSVERLIELTGQSEVPMDVWIDGDQRVRRIEWEQTANEHGTDVRTEMVIEYVRFGVPLDLEIPSEFVDVTQSEIEGMRQGEGW
jgi:hypothetical protein